MNRNSNLTIDSMGLDTAHPNFPNSLSPGLIEFALQILQYTRAVSADALNANKRNDIRAMLKEIDKFRIEIAVSLRQERSSDWLTTADALLLELEKAENRIVDYFKHHTDRKEELIADRFTRKLEELKNEQHQFNSILTTKPNNATERAHIQMQYKKLKKSINAFNSECFQYEAAMSPARYIEIRREFYKFNENFKTDRIEWREQQFNRLTRIQDKAQLLFSDIGSGVSDKWSQLSDFLQGKDEKSLAKRLSRLEREVAISKTIINGMGSMLEQIPTYQPGMQDNVEQLRKQLLELDTSFHLLRERRSLRSYIGSKNYEQRLSEIDKTLKGMNKQVILADLASATHAVTSATSRAEVVVAIERANQVLSFLISAAPNSRGSVSANDMQWMIHAQTSLENARDSAMRNFGLSEGSRRATDALVRPPRSDSIKGK